MNSLSERLQKWAVEELNFVSETGFNQVPDVDAFASLTQGKHKRIWNYVVNHVRSQSSAQKVKHILSLKKRRDEFYLQGAVLDQESSIGKLQVSVVKADEKREFLKKKLSFIEENILSVQDKVDKLTKDTHQILQKTALLQLRRDAFSDKTARIDGWNKDLKARKENLLAYQSSSLLSKQSDLSFSYSFLFSEKINDGARLMDEVYNIAYSVVESKLSSEVTDSASMKAFENSYRDLQKKGYIISDLLMYLMNKSNQDYQNLCRKMLDSLSVEDYRAASKDTKTVMQLLNQLKFVYVQSSLSTIKNESKITNLQSALLQETKKLQEYNENDGMLDSKCRLVEVLAENQALSIVNASLEKHLEQCSRKTELISKECEDVYDQDLQALAEQFYKSADIVFYLLHASTAREKLLSVLKDLQLFVQDNSFQSPLSETELGVRDRLSAERKLTMDIFNKANLDYLTNADPYDIPYPLSPDLRSLPIELYQNFACVCENVLGIKEELKIEAITHSKTQELFDLDVSTIYERIRSAIAKMKICVQESTVCIDDGMVGCEKIRVLTEEWWEQKAQYIPNIVYSGKTLKMWIDILSALDDSDPMYKEPGVET